MVLKNLSVISPKTLKTFLLAQWQPIPRVCPDACEEYSIGFGDFTATNIGVLFGNKYTFATIYLTIEYLKD